MKNSMMSQGCHHEHIDTRTRNTKWRFMRHFVFELAGLLVCQCLVVTLF